MHSTGYIIRFVLILTSIVALCLSLMYTVLKPTHDANEALYAKRGILSAISDHLGTDLTSLSDDEVQGIFDQKIEQFVIDQSGSTFTEQEIVATGEYKSGKAENIDMGKERKKAAGDQMLPLFEYTGDDGKKFYIVSVRGKGLWDEIWGCIALEEDLNTIAGVAFDHKAETPGLGAEIKDNAGFYSQYTGKKLYDDKGNFMSVQARKGGAKNPVHEVDGISGATITANGVNEMIERGIQYYRQYFEKIKRNG